jgi:hypothetical protein
MLISVLMVVAGCQCKNCKDNRAPLIDEFVFTQLVDPASGYNHCSYEHVIGIAKGGSPCKIAVVGLDGWGIADSSSVVVGEVTGPEQFEITGSVIEGKDGAACSSWRYLRVSGNGQLSANLLDLRIRFTDSTNQYNSGLMQYTYERQ